MERHAVHDAGHRQLSHAGLEEVAREVAAREGLGLLEEAVGLVRIGEVGRSDHHVLNSAGEVCQYGRRGGARCTVGLHLDALVVDVGKFAREEAVELQGELLVLLAPRALRLGLRGGPLRQLGVVVHDEVAQTQMAGDAAHALRYLLLNAAVGDVGIGLVGHPLAEARYQETLGNGCTECHGMALAQRARGILHAVEDIHLGMARRDAAPLAQRLEVLRRIEARQRERRVEHRRHVSRVEEEASS